VRSENLPIVLRMQAADHLMDRASNDGSRITRGRRAVQHFEQSKTRNGYSHVAPEQTLVVTVVGQCLNSKWVGILMPQLHATIQTKHHLIARYPCPQCDGHMIRIEPDKLGHNPQPFECSKCGYEAELIAEF
jgi:predicted RNA-binding Zn-ribbon protein involved in translation (DUF1610 family)